MTDTFASGSSAPISGAGEAPGEVTNTLAELERKLRELEQELTSIGRRRARPAPPPPDGAPSPPPPPASGRLIDEAVELAPRVAPAPPPAATPPGSPAPAATPLGSPAPAAPPAGTLDELGGTLLGDAAAFEPGDALPRPTEAQLASLAELRRFRDRIERFGRDLTDEYDALLSRVMGGFGGRPAASAAPATAAAAASAPPAHTPPPSAPPASAAPAPTLPAPAPPPPVPSPSAPPASAPPGPSASAAPAPSPYEDALFEGNVELGVGPFYDIESLGVFERSVARVPAAIDVSVRRFEASHAVVDVRLTAPVALVRELRRALGHDFTVRQVAGGRVSLSFDD